MESLPLYTSCLFSMLLDDDVLDIEKLDGICSRIFFIDQLSGLILRRSIFSITHFKFCINNK